MWGEGRRGRVVKADGWRSHGERGVLQERLPMCRGRGKNTMSGGNRQTCECKFKIGNYRVIWSIWGSFFGTGVMPIGTPVSLGYTLVGFRRVMLLVRGVVV